MSGRVLGRAFVCRAQEPGDHAGRPSAQAKGDADGEEDVEGESGRKAETEYLARKGREIFENDEVQIVVNGREDPYNTTESINLLFGESKNGLGLFRQNTVDPGKSLNDLAKKAGRARLYYSVLFEMMTENEDGDLEVIQKIAKAETSIPLYVQYGERKDQDGQPLTVPLDEYLNALIKTVDVNEEPPTDIAEYSPPDEDQTKYDDLKGEIDGESEFERTKNNFDGYKLGSSDALTGNTPGADTVETPPWSAGKNYEQFKEPPRTSVTIFVPETALKDPAEPVNTPLTAITNAGNAQEANKQLDQALNAGLITPQQANQQRTTINNYYNINNGNTGQTGQTGAAQGAVAGAEAGAAGTGDGLNHCPSPAEGENPPGFFERFLTGPGANAAGYVAGGTLAVAGFPLGLLAAGPVKNAVSNAIKDFGEKYGPGLDQKASTVKNAAVNTVNTVTNTANNVKDAVFGLFSKNKDQDDDQDEGDTN